MRDKQGYNPVNHSLDISVIKESAFAPEVD